MKIEKIKVELLRPAKYNPRKDLKPGDKEYEKLKRSIAEFGYVEPVIWNKTTGNVVGGHQRLKVLLASGLAEVDCVVVELSPAREKALNLALNKIAGQWDEGKLAELILELDAQSFDLSLTGFDVDEMVSLKQQMTAVDIEELLAELDMTKAIEKPIWAVVRTAAENKELLESAIAIIEQKGIRVERSYDN